MRLGIDLNDRGNENDLITGSCFDDDWMGDGNFGAVVARDVRHCRSGKIEDTPVSPGNHPFQNRIRAEKNPRNPCNFTPTTGNDGHLSVHFV